MTLPREEYSVASSGSHTCCETSHSPAVRPAVSIVIPMFNEAASINELHARLTEQLLARGCTYEMVFVDDGSCDATFACLSEVHRADPEHVGVVRLRRNFGQTAALAAGIDHAQGEVIISMDGDLQHDPADLPKFFGKIDEGYDLVSGWREERIDNFVMRRLPSKIANSLIAWMTGIPLHDFGTTYKAYRREILDGLELHGELHRFVPVLLGWQGVSIAEVSIANRARPYGASHYGISRTVRVLFDMLTVKFLVTYVSRPLHIFGLVGGGMFSLGCVIAVALTICYYLGVLEMREHLGNLMFSLLLIMLGVQFVSTGLVMEVMIRTYHAASSRRIYVVRQVVEPLRRSPGVQPLPNHSAR